MVNNMKSLFTFGTWYILEDLYPVLINAPDNALPLNISTIVLILIYLNLSWSIDFLLTTGSRAKEISIEATCSLAYTNIHKF